MKVPYQSLLEFVQTRLSPQEAADALTMAGFELEELLEIDGEPVLDINIMANRGDGASVLGLARELYAKDLDARRTDLFERATQGFPSKDEGSRDVWAHAGVEIQTDACTRFACRIFESIENSESPEWLKKRLRQMGQRPISLLVDLTNYVMLETGQPLHAYDLDKLRGSRIIVRDARVGEKLVTLDEVERELQPGQMVIADETRAIGIAGVMGGAATEADAKTTRCLLEAAHFKNTSVRKTRKELGLFTEASYRFERHVDPAGTVAALNRFAELYASITGDHAVGGVIDVVREEPPQVELTLDLKRAQRLLGMRVSDEEAARYLERLGFEILGQSPGSLDVRVPTWRSDVHREEDLIEDIGRIHGYEKIPEELPIGSTPIGGAHGFEALVDDIREAVLRCGFDQVISHTLGDTDPLDATEAKTRVRTPHSPEMAFLRDSLLPGLADAARRNGANNLHLFEIGRTHGDAERVKLAMLTVGRFDEPSWRPEDETTADFFTLKGAIERVFASTGFPCEFKRYTQDSRMHPTRQAKVLVAGQELGLLGQIHPAVAKRSDLPEGTVIAEFDLGVLRSIPASAPHLSSLSRNPAARRDIAIIAPKDVLFSEIEAAIRKAGGEELERFWLFDVYEGKGVPERHHSLAIALQFRRMGANLTDEETNALRDSVIAALEQLGAKLR